MSVEENNALIREIYDKVFGQGDFSVAERVMAADAVDHDPMSGGHRGPEALKFAVELIKGSFPDLVMTIEDEIFEGDKGMVRVTATGSHQGDFMGARRLVGASRLVSSTSFASVAARSWSTGATSRRCL
ncbi:MAG TPA: ester cyclase [Dehalococcoidia bacterium]|nr:ester cyclase [Dehalococcoidia bacterium]